jgi:hypothetical protein
MCGLKPAPTLEAKATTEADSAAEAWRNDKQKRQILRSFAAHRKGAMLRSG